jgi:hypothetical protein
LKIAFQMPRWLHGKAGLDRDALAIALRQVTPVARAEAAAVQYGSVRNPAPGRSPASENAAQSRAFLMRQTKPTHRYAPCTEDTQPICSTIST